jgi:hypothetical protein
MVLLSDGDASYATLFPEIFGQAYRRARHGERGRFPAVRYHIPRTLVNVQDIKHREGSGVVNIDIRYAHGSRLLIHQTLSHLGYSMPNTSAIERRNGTARRMSAHQVRKSLAFSRRSDTKIALGWWGMMVYNWSRPHALCDRLCRNLRAKKVSASHARHGARSYRLHLVRARCAPYPKLLSRRSETISCHYPTTNIGRHQIVGCHCPWT